MRKPSTNMFVMAAAFISVMLLIVARHHPPSRRKIKEIWHGRVYWERESNTTMLRSSPEKALENVEPKEVNEISTNLGSIGSPPKIPPEGDRAQQSDTKPMIAICAATHSKSNWRSLGDTALQNMLIPSIQNTISIDDRSNYDFRLYLAADHDDHFWLQNKNSVKTPDWLSVQIGFYEVPKQKIPFNPMMRAAFNDGAEYLVRINDDSEFTTSDWVSKTVANLASYNPPNVGMVGPNCREGNTAIMTHDMVHRTHLDIFEHYYPDVFSAWWIDDWISKVYGPQRSTKMMDWTVKHHVHKHGTRYEVQRHEKELLKGELEKGAGKIETWLNDNLQLTRKNKDIAREEHRVQTVVMAAAINYGLSEFKSFVVPLRKVYTGDVILFVNANLPPDVVKLCQQHNIITRALPTGSRLGVKGNRYIGYSEVCNNYQWCFATDFRDVFFQENPFLKLPNADLILFEEDNHVKMGYRKDRPICTPTVSIPCTCPYNANWIRTCWGNEFLSSIADESPICSGTIMGTPRGFVELKDKMLAEMTTTASKDGCTARDQGHFNYLYFANHLDVPTVVQLRGEGIVNTVGYITPRNAINDHLKGGYVVNKDDKASAVVHQYDRFPELNALLRELVHWKKLINTPLDTPNQEMPSASHLNIVPKDIEGTVGSQADNNVDKLISNTLFQKDFVGTFVEFGCSNGIRNSNSLLLEREYGWNGLCIEPNPFEAKFAIKNRKHGIHALLSYPAQDYKYAAMSGHCAQGSGIVEFMNEKSKNNLNTCPKARGEQLNYVTIPGVNLETLLEENHMPSVTWISADCEGCELTFIQNFDFDKYDVRVFSYETSANRETGAKIENLLTEKGFSKHNWKGNDAVYVRNMGQNTSTTKIVSYSLYGSIPRYIDGAIANANLMKEIYPDWTMRVYYDVSVPTHIINTLKAADVELVDMSDSSIKNKMSWRFLAAVDAKRFCARDIDSRLSKREAAAVAEWLQSNKQFHIMRDHPSHSNYPISGGMWCSTTIPNMKDLLTNIKNQAYLIDMNFLNKVIWPMAQKSLLQHDSFSCHKFGSSKPFPTPRLGWQHVGSVYINGKIRQKDVDILKQSGAKGQCNSHKSEANDLPFLLQDSIDNYDADGKSKNVRFYQNTPLHGLLVKLKYIEEEYVTKEFFELSKKTSPSCKHAKDGIFCNVATGGLYLSVPIYNFVHEAAKKLISNSVVCVIGSGSLKLEAMLLSIGDIRVETFDLFQSIYKKMIHKEIIKEYGSKNWNVHGGRFEMFKTDETGFCDLIVFDTNLNGDINDKHWGVVEKYLKHDNTIMVVQHNTWTGYNSYCKTTSSCSFKHSGTLECNIDGCYPDMSIVPSNMHPAVLSQRHRWREAYQYGLWNPTTLKTRIDHNVSKIKLNTELISPSNQASNSEFYLDPKGQIPKASVCLPPCPYTYQSVMSNGIRTVRFDDYPFPSSTPIAEQQDKLNKTLKIFEENNIPYVLGVSPLQLLLKGELNNHIGFLNSVVKKGYICMHGFDHRTTDGTDTANVREWETGGEFARYTPNELESQWQKGNEILLKVNRYTTEHFIPPFNAISQDMVNVLMRHGVKYIHTLDLSVKHYKATTQKKFDGPAKKYSYPGIGGNYGGWLEEYNLNEGVTFVVSQWQKTYAHAHVISPKLHLSQICLHWYYDTSRGDFEQVYRNLVSAITRSLDRRKEKNPSSKIVTATEPLATPNQDTPNNDYVTNKKYIDMCTVSYKTRSKNDFRLPLTPNSIVCVKGDTATLTSFFQLNIRQPFTLVTIEMDNAVPQNALWLNHKYLKRWYSWNSKHSDVIPIPIGLNGDSQLDPMRQATPVTPKIEMALVNFKQDRPVRVSLFNKVKDLKFVHVESYSRKWQNTQELTAHYESISKYKWTLCPRGAGQDTHRLWEALYLGSIPVVLKSSISPLYEGLPVIQLNSWDELSLDMLKERSKSLPLDRSKAYFQHWERIIQSTPLAKQVISYSLYGSNPRYTDGALENAKLMKKFYPEWTMRVYYDDTVPHNTMEQLRQEDVQLVDMTGSHINKMAWRFQAAADSARFCARDIDSRLSEREAAAVKEWLESGKHFHVMRDHPSHSKYAMSGGMWCSTTIPNIETLLTGVENQAYLQDMDFLNKVIWPMAQKSLLQHDSFSCDKFGGGKPFPTPRVGWEHVGSVYINGKMRQGDVDILKRKGVVKKCTVSITRYHLMRYLSEQVRQSS